MVALKKFKIKIKNKQNNKINLYSRTRQSSSFLKVFRILVGLKTIKVNLIEPKCLSIHMVSCYVCILLMIWNMVNHSIVWRHELDDSSYTTSQKYNFWNGLKNKAFIFIYISKTVATFWRNFQAFRMKICRG